MDEPDSRSEDFSGVSPSAGPAGDGARQLLALRLSLAFSALGLGLWILLIGYLVASYVRDVELVTTMGPALASLLLLWMITAAALMLGRAARGVESSMSAACKWLLIALSVTAIVGSILATFFVAVPIVFLALFFGVAWILTPLGIFFTGVMRLLVANLTGVSSGRR